MPKTENKLNKYDPIYYNFLAGLGILNEIYVYLEEIIKQITLSDAEIPAGLGTLYETYWNLVKIMDPNVLDKKLQSDAEIPSGSCLLSIENLDNIKKIMSRLEKFSNKIWDLLTDQEKFTIALDNYAETKQEPNELSSKLSKVTEISENDKKISLGCQKLLSEFPIHTKVLENYNVIVKVCDELLNEILPELNDISEKLKDPESTKLKERIEELRGTLNDSDSDLEEADSAADVAAALKVLDVSFGLDFSGSDSSRPDYTGKMGLTGDNELPETPEN